MSLPHLSQTTDSVCWEASRFCLVLCGMELNKHKHNFKFNRARLQGITWKERSSIHHFLQVSLPHLSLTSWKEDMEHWATVQFFFSLTHETLLMLSQVQEWLDSRNPTVIVHVPDMFVHGGFWSTDLEGEVINTSLPSGVFTTPVPNYRFRPLTSHHSAPPCSISYCSNGWALVGLNGSSCCKRVRSRGAEGGSFFSVWWI